LSERTDEPATYAAAGVDIDAAERLVGRIKELVRTAGRPEVLAGVGPFAGLFRLGQYREPVLVSSTDSVGTKVKLAALMGRYDTVGMDVVNHCINDILTAGAEPLFFLDYLASSDLGDEEKLAVVRGLVSACRSAGCALIGGETADMPDLYAPGDFDLVGFVVGVVERDCIIDGSSIHEGDVLLGLPSSGLHTNGYSLARQVFSVAKGGDLEAERAVLDRYYPGLGITLGEALLVPHRCYYQELRPLLGHINGMAHITGGGIPGNVARIIPDGPSAGSGRGLAARFDAGSWRVPPIFDLIQKTGGISDDEMYRVFNMGLGMVLACSEEGAAAVQHALPEAKVVGRVVRQTARWRVLVGAARHSVTGVQASPARVPSAEKQARPTVGRPAHKALKHLLIYTDGAADPNPGPAGIGLVILDEDGTEILRRGEYIGEHSNNEAEYAAMIRGLELASKLGAKTAICHCDSQLLIRQVNGLYKVKAPRLRELLRGLRDLQTLFDKLEFVHLRREDDRIRIADKLSYQAVAERRTVS